MLAEVAAWDQHVIVILGTSWEWLVEAPYLPEAKSISVSSIRCQSSSRMHSLSWVSCRPAKPRQRRVARSTT